MSRNSSRNRKTQSQSMSLESAMDQERREVLALLEGTTLNNGRKDSDSGPAAGAASAPSSPKPAVRSMLDHGTQHTAVWSLPDKKKKKSASKSPAPGYRNQDPSSYTFDMSQTVGSGIPKRVTQGGKKQPRAMSQVYGENAGRRGRHNSTAGILGQNKSQSPSSRLMPNNRSSSPGLNTNSLNLMADPTKWVTESGKVINMNNAYRKLSNSAISRSGGSLADLPMRQGSEHGEAVAPDGGVRLEMDYDDNDEDAIDSGDENDDELHSSDDEDSDSDGGRGRRRSRFDENGNPKSLLASAEDERLDVASKNKVRSMLDPTINVTGPDGERMSQKKKGIHPHTSYDQDASGANTPISSDTEADLSDIKRAQRMSMTVGPIQPFPDAQRCVRQVVRGDYDTFRDEAEQGMRRQRMYLVATDLSDEAAYALEWTIGTVLRDGDTLIAVYAVDEELGTGGSSNVTAMQESDFLAKTLSNDRAVSGPSRLSQSFTPDDIKKELPKPADPSTMDKAARERWNATAEVSDRIVKLLRKTRLQVRVIVEVFHCKSPKHVITEVIDFLDPSLVILGSRGRSALKGVLLGSFSNYLVTKSSAPVMVARKRLRKHNKYRRTNLRLSNVLNPVNKLANAKVD